MSNLATRSGAAGDRIDYSTPGPYPLVESAKAKQAGRRALRHFDQVHYAAHRDAVALGSPYVQALNAWTRQSGLVLDDSPRMADLGAPFVAIHEQHRTFFTTSAGRDARALDYLRNLPTQIPEKYALISWYLLYQWLVEVFGTFVFGRDGSAPVAVARPAIWAMPFADVALILLASGGGPLTAGLSAQMLATSRAEPWGPPPWK
jgi:hypothetical protein